MRRLVPVLALLALLASACGAEEPAPSAVAPGAATPSASAAATPRASAAAAGDSEELCEPYTTIVTLFEEGESIALGSADGQERANEALADAVDEIDAASEGAAAELQEALGFLEEASFSVSEDTSGPSESELDDALQTLEGLIGANCEASADGDGSAPDADAAAECPAPETLEAEGLECDEFGNISQAGEIVECPAPETLEAQGLECDEFGKLTPADDAEAPAEDEPAECPAPETLEAEGLQCDEFGNLTPADDPDSSE